VKYTVDYFIEKFSAIPDEKWWTGDYENKGRFCALGHCGEKFMRGGMTEESMALGRLFEEYLICAVASVNDGKGLYPQPTPKARILAALQDIKAKELQPC
jgi:hypothetical protein